MRSRIAPWLPFATARARSASGIFGSSLAAGSAVMESVVGVLAALDEGGVRGVPGKLRRMHLVQRFVLRMLLGFCVIAPACVHVRTGESDAARQAGARNAPTTTTAAPAQEWIYGPREDWNVHSDGSTGRRTWTTPDDFPDRATAIDKLNLFNPVEGRRPVSIPPGTRVKRGRTPGGWPYSGSGGANETLIPEGLPPGSAGPWVPLP